MGKSESFTLALDLGTLVANGNGSGELDGNFDVVLGYPSQQAGDSDPFPCGSALDTTCFGVYLYSGTERADPYNRFRYTTSGGVLPHPAVDHNALTSVAKPDLEWTISNFNGLRQKLRLPLVDSKGVLPWALQLRAFGGSFQDDGVGEDFIPNNADYVRVDFPCQLFDECDVCGGDNSRCKDCKGVVLGSAKYDRCDVCGGDSSSCKDCKGVAGGDARYDECDVCAGDGSSCRTSVPCSDDFTKCRLNAGDIFSGHFNRTSQMPPMSGQNVSLSIGPYSYAALTGLANKERTLQTDLVQVSMLCFDLFVFVRV